MTANSIRQWNLQRMRNNLEVKVPLAQTNSLLLATAAVTTGCGNNLKAKFESKRQRTASMSSRLGTIENRVILIHFGRVKGIIILFGTRDHKIFLRNFSKFLLPGQDHSPESQESNGKNSF